MGLIVCSAVLQKCSGHGACGPGHRAAPRTQRKAQTTPPRCLPARWPSRAPAEGRGCHATSCAHTGAAGAPVRPCRRMGTDLGGTLQNSGQQDPLAQLRCLCKIRRRFCQRLQRLREVAARLLKQRQRLVSVQLHRLMLVCRHRRGRLLLGLPLPRLHDGWGVRADRQLQQGRGR